MHSPNFDKIRNKTRTCNDARSWCCGGNGQRVQVRMPFKCIVGGMAADGLGEPLI